MDDRDRKGREGRRFTLSWPSTICAVVIIAVSTGMVAMVTHGTPEAIGAAMGQWIVQLCLGVLVAFACGWMAWRLCRGKRSAGGFTFNVMLILSVAVLVPQHVAKVYAERAASVEQLQAVHRMEASREAFQQSLKQEESLETLEASYDQFHDSVQDELGHLAASSTGTDQVFFNIVKAYHEEVDDRSADWADVFSDVMDQGVLDYSRLNHPDEFNRQRAAVTSYIEATQGYQVFFNGILTGFRQRLLGWRQEGDAQFREAMQVATISHFAQKTVMDPLMVSHLSYGQHLIQALDWLERYQAEWSMESGELIIPDPRLRDEFNAMLDELIENEAAIQHLSIRLAETL